LANRDYTILLDILFGENQYSTTLEKSINNELLVIEHKYKARHLAPLRYNYNEVVLLFAL